MHNDIKSKLLCKLQALSIMMCYCRFISYNKCNTMVGDANNEEDYAYAGTEGYEKSLET